MRACSPVQYGVVAALNSAFCSDLLLQHNFSDDIVFSSCSVNVRVTPLLREHFSSHQENKK